TGGTLNTIGGNLTVGTFNESGNVTGAGDLTVTGPWNFTGGTMGGTGRTFLNGASTLSVGGNITDRNIKNAGTATLGVGQTLSFAGAAIWDNLATGTFVLPGGSTLNGNAGTPFNNAGTLRKVGTGNASVGSALNNTGLVDVQAGSLTIASGSN